jgi:hypothetical protein
VSSLIYAVILGAWAAVLIPMWLRRHDEAAESRSVDRFSSAMRVLARREPAQRPEQRYVVMPARERVAHVTVTGATAAVRAPRHAGRSRLTARRRRVAVGLLVAAVVSAAVTPFTVVPWYAPVAVVGVLLLYAVHLRVQARRAEELARRRRSVQQRVVSRERRVDSAERVVAVRRTRDKERAGARAAAEAARIEAEAAAAELAEAERRKAAGWEPVPVPLPTYVTKPKAARSSRSIDLGTAGAWTGSAAPAAGERVTAEGDAGAAPPARDVAANAGGGDGAEGGDGGGGGGGRQVADDRTRLDAVLDGEIDALVERPRAVND